MKLTIVFFLLAFTVAFCQPDKVFKEQITVEKGIKYGDGTIQLTAGGSGSMLYPAAGIPLSTGTAWGTSIVNNSANWNTAYGWGNHAGLYRPIGYVPSWTEVTGKPATFPSAWATVSGKPTVFNPDLAVTNPLYRPITWKPDYVTDVINKPPELELTAALAELGIYLTKTTIELNAITPANGFGIAYDKTLNVYKVYSNGWKIVITNQ